MKIISCYAQSTHRKWPFVKHDSIKVKPKCYYRASSILAPRYAIALCLSVCPPQVGVLSKRLNFSSPKPTPHDRLIARCASFPTTQIFVKFQWVIATAAPPTRRVWKICEFRQNSLAVENDTRQVHGFYESWNRKSYALYRTMTLPMTVSDSITPNQPYFYVLSLTCGGDEAGVVKLCI